ncbi:MAG: hypothetical protein WD361_10735 [Gracilimonas sp.]
MQTFKYRVEAYSARFISDIFNPLALPVLVYAMAGISMGHPPYEILKVGIITLNLFFVIPLFTALSGIKLNFGKSLDFNARTGRIYLYLISIVSVGFGGIYIFRDQLSGLYNTITLIYLTNLSIAFIANLRWKVSVHLGSVIIASTLLFWLSIYSDSTYLLAICAFSLLAISPFVLWARLKLKVHNMNELVFGAILGLMTTVIAIYLFT